MGVLRMKKMRLYRRSRSEEKGNAVGLKKLRA